MIPQYRQYLQAMLTDDRKGARKVADELGDGPWEGTGKLNLAVFGLAVDRQFADDSSHAAVMKFVGTMYGALRTTPQAPDPLHIELLVRAALGEPQLFIEVPEEARNVIMPIVSYAIVRRLDLSPTEVDDLLDTAVEAASA